MRYALLILRRAQRQLTKLPQSAFNRIRNRIRGLSEDPRPPGARKLRGRNGWRLRVGDYRVLYDIDDAERTVIVLHIGHRRDVYR